MFNYLLSLSEISRMLHGLLYSTADVLQKEGVLSIKKYKLRKGELSRQLPKSIQVRHKL